MQTITSNADSFGNGLISVGLQNQRPLPWMARQAEYPRLQAGRCRQPLAVWQRMAPLETSVRRCMLRQAPCLRP